MSMTQKLHAGATMPVTAVPKVGGGELRIGGGGGTWQMLIVYRGKHCPLCQAYLKILDRLFDDFLAIQTEVIAVSADSKEKAETEAAAEGWRFPVGYDLSILQMRELGLYVSEPRSPEETDRPFAEPGLFVVNPAGHLQIVDISNAPFARPELHGVLNGLKFVQEKNYPIRGTVA